MDKASKESLSKGRLEAFSDGVIAIIITLMILEIKIPNLEPSLSSRQIWGRLSEILPHVIAYILSFLVLGIMWVNHHHLLHSIKNTDRRLLWYNLHLLFWMSLIPLPTALLGEHPFTPEATACYGFILFMSASAFAMLRWYAQDKAQLFHEHISEKHKRRYRVMNATGTGLYFVSIFTGYLTPIVSIAIFVIVPAIYFMPLNVEFKDSHEEIP
jgi:uncharacterized membrane protein